MRDPRYETSSGVKPPGWETHAGADIGRPPPAARAAARRTGKARTSGSRADVLRLRLRLIELGA